MTACVPGKSLSRSSTCCARSSDGRQVGALHLDADRRLDAGVLHHDARVDRLRPAVDVADDLHRLVHLGDQLVLGHPGPPLRRRLQRDRRLDHLDRRRIGRGIGASELAEHALDFRERLQLLVHLLQDPARLLRRQPGQRRRHVEDGALLHLRHVVLLEAGHDHRGADQQHRAQADERIPVANRADQRPAVGADEAALRRAVGRRRRAA